MQLILAQFRNDFLDTLMKFGSLLAVLTLRGFSPLCLETGALFVCGSPLACLDFYLDEGCFRRYKGNQLSSWEIKPASGTLDTMSATWSCTNSQVLFATVDADQGGAVVLHIRGHHSVGEQLR